MSDKKDENKKKEEPVATGDSTTESAAITQAKKAAKSVLSQGDSVKKSSTNLEIEASSDLENSQRIAELESNSSAMADAGLSR